MKAAWTGWSSVPRATPSIVRISARSWLIASARHELIRRPSTRTVHAPHWPRSHPFLVPVRSRRSRRRSRSVTRGSPSSMSCRTPFTVRLMERFMQCSDSAIVKVDRDRHTSHIDRQVRDWRRSAWIYGGSLRFSSEKDNETSHMGDPSAEAARRPRVDAVRNRERLLEAAKAIFSAGGPDASLEAVARRAGVGIGTLYRHFPTREALFEAVYRREVQQLVELAEQLRSEAEPVEALRRWLLSYDELVTTKKGMLAALALAVHGSSELYAYSFDRLTKAIDALLDRAVASGEIRADVGPEDLLRALVGMCYIHDQPGWQASVVRLLDVFVDGLCVEATVTESVRQRSQRQESRKSRA